MACLLVASVAAFVPASCGGDGKITDPQLLADLQRVKKATAKYKDVKKALADGYKPAGQCLNSPNGDGAMGIHYNNERLQRDSKNILTKPEQLLYEPGPRGKRTLVGVEYYVTDLDQAPPEIPLGHLDGPMTGHTPGAPSHFDLHVWLFKANPNGMFDVWNPDVRC